MAFPRRSVRVASRVGCRAPTARGMVPSATLHFFVENGGALPRARQVRASSRSLVSDHREAGAPTPHASAPPAQTPSTRPAKTKPGGDLAFRGPPGLAGPIHGSEVVTLSTTTLLRCSWTVARTKPAPDVRWRRCGRVVFGSERLLSLLRSLSYFRAFQLRVPLFFPGAAPATEFCASQTLATHRHGGKKKV